MNNSKQVLTEIQNIRKIMEHSSKFLSLSGLSGILTGVYALIGSFLTYHIVYVKFPPNYRQEYIIDILISLVFIGISVLVLSLTTTLILTIRKAKKAKKPIWGSGSKLLLLNLAIPLLTGAIFSTVLVLRGYYGIISPAFLIFYGLALVNAAKYTRPEILGLGILEIVLGLIAASFPGYGLFLWSIGFGVMHIIYGALYLKNESKETVL